VPRTLPSYRGNSGGGTRKFDCCRRARTSCPTFNYAKTLQQPRGVLGTDHLCDDAVVNPVNMYYRIYIITRVAAAEEREREDALVYALETSRARHDYEDVSRESRACGV